MSDHETWLNDQDKTAQWPTTPPYGLGSSEGEHTEPLGVASSDELSAPNFASQAEGTPPEAPAAQAQPGTTPVAEETAGGPALGQPSFGPSQSDQPGAAHAPVGPLLRPATAVRTALRSTR